MTARALNTSGFTLIELLVSLSLAGILLTTMYSIFKTSINGVGTVRDQNQLIFDVRTAGNFVADTLNAAVYIYPPKIQLSLTTIDPTNQYATQHLGTSRSWTVQTDPFIAGLLPPNDRTVTCNTTTPYSSTSPTAASQAGCYRIAAFYSVARSAYVAAAPTLANPGNDATIPSNAQLLMYYWAYVNPDNNSTVPWPTSGFQGRATLLADYLTSGGMVFEDSATWKCTDPTTGGIGTTGGSFTNCSDITSPVISGTNAQRLVSATQLSVTLQTGTMRNGQLRTISGLRFWIGPRNVGLGAKQ
ncbi:prepilin-type N-terminal cleavage/methylation domain-containing protein (plasmid) [Deinococcus sp. KNUC1210]|uniref:PulJ/GspJ family protein n=1 Tax=Deinococcus sp. KNUC1210 TaxID=2917691 RepID=UPI001EF0C20F|nr:prepilin-type N-terminal cleavage/methylation domain-containing protein [Deinococcus sp. KNUC1210]ULH17704.1 prepilin-type N-terminal cleavage/methylation domain-containing protein [Deinococcus sp. KNUC1210]